MRSRSLGGALALVEPLKAVDRALVDQRGIEHALRAYAGWSTVVIVALAALAVPALHPGRVRKALLALVAAAALVTVIVGGVVETRPGSTVHHLISTLGNVDADPALNAAPGETRLISLSFNGRRDAWRVAWSMGREHIVGGHGQGTFPIFWVRERHLDQLYILQPHSILLELLAELGAVGLALFVVAIGSLAGGLARRPPGALPAAAVGGLFALVVQAAVDWTWSFPVLVASVLLVAGAALGGPRGRPPGVPALVAGTAVLLCAIAAFVAPWISNHRVGQAKASSVSDPVFGGTEARLCAEVESLESRCARVARRDRRARGGVQGRRGRVRRGGPPLAVAVARPPARGTCGEGRAGPPPPGPRLRSCASREPGGDSPLRGGLLSGGGQSVSSAAAPTCRAAQFR